MQRDRNGCHRFRGFCLGADRSTYDAYRRAVRRGRAHRHHRKILAEQVKNKLGTVIIENRPGGGGNIGVDAVTRAEPDGSTLGIATIASHGINPWLFSKLPFDPEKDFAAITLMVRVPNVLVIYAETAQRLRIQNVADLIRYAKANPGKLNFGSGGNGSAGHLAGELFKSKAGIFAVHIPYNGGAPAQVALLAGHVDFTFDNLATAAPNIRAGKIKALAVTTAQRSSFMPELPTVGETLKDFEVDTWWGLIAPAGTPPTSFSNSTQLLPKRCKAKKPKHALPH